MPIDYDKYDVGSGDFAPGWQPSPNDEVEGFVVETSERTSEYGAYPIVTLQQMDGERVALHAMHKGLQAQLARYKVKEGDFIHVTYYGKETVNGPKGKYVKHKYDLERHEGREMPEGFGNGAQSFEDVVGPAPTDTEEPAW